MTREPKKHVLTSKSRNGTTDSPEKIACQIRDAAASPLAGGTTAATYDWSVGKSIEKRFATQKQPIATFNEGANAVANKKMLERQVSKKP